MFRAQINSYNNLTISLKTQTASQSYLTRQTSNSDVCISLYDVNSLQVQKELQLFVQVGQQNNQSCLTVKLLFVLLVERIGIEPMTPCLQSRCSPI